MDLEHVKEAWDEWEIHFLILLSLSLQVFLSLTADLRRRSASRLLSNVLWLAYMSADTVAVFVLGHLAVHAQGPRHELMLFWVPFVLLHLGGQDTITAFSKQDNELWTRHLLGLVTQTAVAGYVVSKSSWPDVRLRTAMVLMFISGFLKYAGRTYCLFSASPKSLRASSMASLLFTLTNLQIEQALITSRNRKYVATTATEILKTVFYADKCWEFINKKILFIGWSSVDDIMLLDAPVDNWEITLVADELPDLLKEVNMSDRCIAYQYVAACLRQSYQCLYTKAPLLSTFWEYLDSKLPDGMTWILFVLTSYTSFHFISTLIALVLFASAQKQDHDSKADITVSYILLVGAIFLDLLPAFTSIGSYARKPFRPRKVAECAVMSCQSCFQPRGCLTRKQWSEELAQYGITRRHTTSVEDYPICSSLRKWIVNHKLISAWCAEFFDVTHTPVTDDLKLFVLDKLLFLQTRRQEWDFASFRGNRALGKWMDSHRVPEAQRSSYARHKSLSSKVNFPASVLIWHIATDICYFSEDNVPDTTAEPDEIKKKKKKMMKMSRELSHYIMYLVFKCDVMLTSNSRLAHEKAHERLAEFLSCQSETVNLDEQKAVIKVFAAMKNEEQQQGSIQGVGQDRKKNEEAKETSNDAGATSNGSGVEELLQRTLDALYSPVLPLAHDVAQELIGINDEAHRWEHISEVWLEMLFYTAPRCGAAFHYEHLSTGGEFITHVFFLMRLLGPFMPKPGA